MNASLWTAVGEGFAFVLAGTATVWAKRGATKTDTGNDSLNIIRGLLQDQGRKLDRVEDKLDTHIRDHARSHMYWAKD